MQTQSESETNRQRAQDEEKKGYEYYEQSVADEKWRMNEKDSMESDKNETISWR